MTMLSRSGRKARILTVFCRTGSDGNETRPFDSFPNDVQDSVRRGAALEQGEEPILVSFRAENCWVLLTSDSLFINLNTEKTRLRWEEIGDATIDAAEANNALADTVAGKLKLRRLRVRQRDGVELALELEPGPSFVGFWNALKTVAVLSKGGP